MPVTIHRGENFGVVRLAGTISRSQYSHWLAALREILTEHDTARLLVRLEYFAGWEMNSEWSDVDFVSARSSSVERLAFVGDRKWEQWMAGFRASFPNADTMFFSTGEVEEALAWLEDSSQSR